MKYNQKHQNNKEVKNNNDIYIVKSSCALQMTTPTPLCPVIYLSIYSLYTNPMTTKRSFLLPCSLFLVVLRVYCLLFIY